MSINITPNDVRDVIGSISLTNEQINGFINAGILIVTEDLTGSRAGKLSDARRRLIALFLAAHFITLQVQSQQSIAIGSDVRIDNVALETRFSIGKGLELTRFGQQAVALDPSGRLRQLASGGTFSLTVTHAQDANAEYTGNSLNPRIIGSGNG